MFGRDWESAKATIVTRRLIEQGHGGEGGHLSYEVYEYIADVQPDSGAPAFRAPIKEPFNGLTFQSPDVGQTVQVKFQRKDQHVKFDRADPGIHRDVTHRKQDKQAVAEANSQEAQARFDAVMKAPPGTTPAPDPASPVRSAGLTDVSAAVAGLSAAVVGMAASTANFSDTIDAIKRARASGDLAEVTRLKAEFKSRTAESLGSSDRTVARPTPEPAPSDPLDRLQKLADLHDRGVLTDAEFAAEKAKILSQG
jgi:Short C-terminal domain